MPVDCDPGSSPRMRGVLRRPKLPGHPRRFIPHARSTARSKTTRSSTSVHPRVCGECPLVFTQIGPVPGSSGRVKGCRELATGRKGRADDPGRCGSGSAAGREPAANTRGGGRRRDRLFCVPDCSVRAAQALCPGRSQGGRRVADRSAATGRGGDRTEPRPVRRHRLLVVHRGDPGPGWPARGPLFRDRVPGQRPVVRGHAFRGRGGRRAGCSRRRRGRPARRVRTLWRWAAT